MKAPLVRFRLADGAEVELAPGAIIGRLPAAALRLNDPRVSEAHAMLSLRGQQLKLLALRGLISEGDKPTPSVVLRAGQTVYLAPNLPLEVMEVVLPEAVLALEGPWPAPVELSAGVYSLNDAGVLEARYIHESSLHIWSGGDDWTARVDGGEARTLRAGDTLVVGKYNIHVVWMPLAQRPALETVSFGRFFAPLRLICAYDSARLEAEGHMPLVLAGNQARIVSELVAFGGPVEWETVAREIWRDEGDRAVLRQNWDRNMSALRSRLKAADIRPDLIRADGKGKVELILLPGDRVEDRG